jgi:hypothetical protein
MAITRSETTNVSVAYQFVSHGLELLEITDRYDAMHEVVLLE